MNLFSSASFAGGACGPNGNNPDCIIHSCPNDTGTFTASGNVPQGFFPTSSKCQCPGQDTIHCSVKGSSAWTTCGDASNQEQICSALPSLSSSSKSSKPSAASEVDDCEQSEDNVMNHDCDLRKNAQTSAAINMGTMLLKTMSSNPTMACSQFGDFSVAAQAALLAYDQMCSSAISDCQEKCDTSAIADPSSDPGRQMAFYLRQCNKMANQEKPDYSVILQAAGMMQMQSTTCLALKSAITNPVCAANPTAVGCAGYSASDCSNPANAGSATCQCILNPAKCSAAGAGTGGNPNSAGSPFANGAANAAMMGGAGSAGAGGGLGSSALDSGFGNLGTPAGGPSGSKNGGGGPSGAGMNAGGVGTGSAAVNPKKGAMMGGKADAPGFKSLYGGLVNPGGGGGGGSVRPPLASGDKKVLGQDKILRPDFNQFRPNMPYDPSRALAGGMSGKAYSDGITGPETDIWEKVKNQYSQQSTRGAFFAK